MSGRGDPPLISITRQRQRYGYGYTSTRRVALKSTSGRLQLFPRNNIFEVENLQQNQTLTQSPIDYISTYTSRNPSTTTATTNTSNNVGEIFYGFLNSILEKNLNGGGHRSSSRKPGGRQNDDELNKLKHEIAKLKADHAQEMADLKGKLNLQIQMTRKLEQKLRKNEEETNRRNLKMAEFRAFSDRTFANLLPSEIEINEL